jgi:hypothetical protein
MSAQHAAAAHEPEQQRWPAGHCASFWQAQLLDPQVWLARSQH